MKYKYILPTLAAMGMLVASCSNDEFLSKVQGGSGQLVTVSASAAGGETRMAVTETASGDVKFTWESSDKLYVINPSNAEITPFALTEGAGKSRGTFSGTPTQAYTSGQELMALFTKNQASPACINSERNGVYIDLSGQDGTLTDKYQYMFGQGIYQLDGNVEFSLSNLVSVVKATVNNLPQDETFSKIIFSDEYSSYRSNAYLMLQDGRHGDSEYHAGDLVRKGTVYSYNGQWNNPVDPEEEYEPAITLNGSFSAAEGSLTKYFYVMETGSTIIYNDYNGSGVNDSFIGSRNMIQPFVLLMGTQHVYSATANNPKYIGGGKIFDLQLNAQALPEITLNTPMQVSARDANYQQLYYVFKATTAGTYKVGGDTGYFFPLSDNANTHYGPNTTIEMAADELIILSFDGNSTVTIQPVVPLEVDKEYAVNPGDCYPFTPTETGLYKLDGLNYNFNIQQGEGPEAQWISSNPAVLTAGVTYKYNFYGNATFTFKKIETGTLNLGATNTCESTGNQGERKFFLFTPSTTGMYKFTMPAYTRVRFDGIRIPDKTESTEESIYQTFPLEAGKTYITSFEGIESENKSINVGIANIGSYSLATPGETMNVSAGQYILIENNTNESYLYHATGTASVEEPLLAIDMHFSSFIKCTSAGSLTISIVDKSAAEELTLNNEPITFEAGKLYAINVTEVDGYHAFTYIEDSEGNTVTKILGYNDQNVGWDIKNDFQSYLPSGKIYFISPKTITITFSQSQRN